MEPFKIGEEGYTDFIGISYDKHSDLTHSCSVTYKDHLYVFGGQYEPLQVRPNYAVNYAIVHVPQGYDIVQVSILRNCNLSRQMDLPFQFFDGSCGIYDFQQGRGDEVFLCFANIRDQNRKCNRYISIW